MSRYVTRKTSTGTSHQHKKVRFAAYQPTSSTASGTLGAPISDGKPDTEARSSNDSILSFVRLVQQTLGPQSSQYREFATVMQDLLTLTTARPEMNTMRTVDCIEQIVLLLDGHPGLVANVQVALPPGFTMDLQPDAVVIKVCDTSGDWNIVDTGHSRSVGDLDDVIATLLPSDALSPVSRRQKRSKFERSTTNASRNYATAEVNSSVLVPRIASQSSTRVVPPVIGGGTVDPGTRSRTTRAQTRRLDAHTTRWNSSSTPQRTTTLASNVIRKSTSPQLDMQRDVRSTKATRRPVNKLPTGENKLPTGESGKTFISDVKKALHRRPDVYHKFVNVLKHYHEQRFTGRSTRVNYFDESARYDQGDRSSVSDSVGTTDGELETIREVVTLLKANPELVLAFNDFLPDGYRIRMFEKSAYVIEHPTSVAANANFIRAGMEGLRVAV